MTEYRLTPIELAGTIIWDPTEITIGLRKTLPEFLGFHPLIFDTFANFDSMDRMQSKYREFREPNLPEIEKETLALWEMEKTFEKSVEIRDGNQRFVFYEGPPSANGLPGIHHVISRTLKDLVCRFKTMQGYQVSRKGGWDTHGLPVELGVEKELGITKEDIGIRITVEEYNQKCREAVLRFKDNWDDLTRKMGYWVDLEHPYVTFTNEYIETLWFLLKQLHAKGLLYKSVSIQPYSPAAGTGLSSHELNMPGTYKEVKDTSCVAMFKAIENARSSRLFEAARKAVPGGKNPEIFFLAWTTTPWTLPGNLGLTVGPSIDYLFVQTKNPYSGIEVFIIVARALFHQYFENPGKLPLEPGSAAESDTKEGRKQSPGWKIVDAFKGRELEECRYEQLLPFEANAPEKSGGDPFRVLLGDFVTTEDGTGIVHTAPAFGADDFKVGKKYGIGILVMVDREGKFVEGLGEFSHRFVKNYKDQPDYVDVNVDIAVKLKKENRAFKIEKYEHSYPHCWRTDKPVLYYPLDAWFIKTTALKEKMVELNNTIQWKPRATGEGRFGNWLENLVDWNLSRSRFWGTPLPVWRTPDGLEEICIGSIGELNAEIRKAGEVLGGSVNKNYLHDGILDLHKPYVDEVVLVSPSGKPMYREPDLIDVWFDSGAMPYAQWGLDYDKLKAGDPRPFREPFNTSFPADFIAEGVDQTRGWFYTLHAIASLVYEEVAFKTVVSNGLVLDKNGNKMSKRLGNVVNPFDTIEKYGADATRWYLITNTSPWDNLKFDINGIREVQRKFFGTLYNTYQFFVIYANVDGFAFKEKEIPVAERPEIDQWIISSLHSLIVKVEKYLNDYEPTLAGRAIEDFLDLQLSNWYVRLCRRRFWKGDYGTDKISAYQTLYECLETMVRLMAPISPFFSDRLYRNLNEVTGRFKEVSVHHTLFPKADLSKIEPALEERMGMAQDVSSLILSIRKKVNIKVRQPLQQVLIPVLDSTMENQLKMVEDLIKAEVNVKEIRYLGTENEFIHKKIKPNYVALGKKLGAKMKEVGMVLSDFTQEDIRKLEREGQISLMIRGETLVLNRDEVEIQSEDLPGWMVAGNGLLTVALDISLTPDLVNEGNAREFVNRVQKIRKENGYELTDRILVKVSENEKLKPSITQFNNYICAEILADNLELLPDIPGGTEIEVNDIPLKILISKKG